MKRSHLIGAVCAYFLLSVSSPVNAVIIASSTFDTGADGWTWAAGTGMTWESVGGNPGGYIKHDNNTNTVNSDLIFAPAQFLGDWQSMGVNQLTYEHKIFVTGAFVQAVPYTVTIRNDSAGASAQWQSATIPTTATDWTPLIVPVAESAWTVQSGTWGNLITNVTSLEIKMQNFVNTSSFEITGVDNVALNAVPVPAAFWLFGSGLLGLIGIARRKKTT